jgi:16S rRNA (cytosine967-C5)-methyltransferase
LSAAPGLAQALCAAARLVARVAAGGSLTTELARVAEDGAAAGRQRAALIDLTHGTLRRYGRVQAIVRDLSRRQQGDALVEALLWCGLYALESGRYADYAVVDQAVGACALLDRPAAKGFVNAVLRGFLRRRSALEARIAADPQARFQHPLWWIELVRTAHPQCWQEILAAGNSHPPMCLRVNLRRTSLAEYRARLAASGIAARALGDAALLLERPLPAASLPGFDAGEVSVQDAGAQRAAALLDVADGQRVLDACAAPGGKSAHILERAAVDLVALDADEARCNRLAGGLARLGLAARVQRADCRALDAWWDGRPFERILADVPCSASGAVRRHPDIKWLRRARDVPAFAVSQAQILDALWRALAADGKLLYVTCSVFPQENEGVVEAFLARTPEAARLALPGGAPAQLFPGPEHDGFYFALLRKRP